MTPASAVPAVVAAGLVSLAVLLALPGRRRGPGPPAPRRLLLLMGSAVVLVGASAWLDVHDLVLAVLAALCAAAVSRLLRRRRGATVAQRRSDQVLAACDALASDLVAGQPPSTALERAAAEWDELAPVAAAGRMGADVPDALRSLAARPGAVHLRRVAATWQVAHDTGAGLAGAMESAADAIRSDMRTGRLVATELAAAHATARMLAVLPIGVLLLGIGVGGDPLGFLFRSTPGMVVLAAGLGLSFAGLSWLDRIADGVLRR